MKNCLPMQVIRDVGLIGVETGSVGYWVVSIIYIHVALSMALACCVG